MKVYRGPKSKPFSDATHVDVAHIKPEELESAIGIGTKLEFTIDKDAIEKSSICTAFFEDDDIVPIIRGVLIRLLDQQRQLRKIKEIVDDKSIHHAKKISDIQTALKKPNA